MNNMRKLRLFSIIAAAAIAAAGCQKYDDSAILSRLDSQDQKIEALETALKALSSQDYVTAVTEITEDGVTVGYKITFAKSGEVTVGLHSKAGLSVEVTEDSVTFTTPEGTSFSIPRYPYDHLNLPNCISMKSKEINNVVKGDTLIISVIVSPSDFVLSTDNTALLSFQTLYTKFDTKYDEDGQEVQTPFDHSAACTLRTVSVERHQNSYEGLYDIKAVIGGTGNFFCSNDTYAYVSVPDHNGKYRDVVSATSCRIEVIPTIEEGLCVDCPPQSFYTLDDRYRASENAKPYHVILWSNAYKSENGEVKYYDRTLISSISIAQESPLALSDEIVTEDFQESGIVSLKPVLDSDYWKETLAKVSEENLLSTTMDDAALFICRGRESAVVPVAYKSLYSVCKEHEFTVKRDDIIANDKSYTFDLTQDFIDAGDEDTYPSSFRLDYNQNFYTHLHGNPGIVTLDGKSIQMNFFGEVPVTTQPFQTIGVFKKHMTFAQDKEGFSYRLEKPYVFFEHSIISEISVVE